MRCVVVDDEPVAVEILSGYCRKTPFLELAGAFQDAVEALGFVQERKVDLIFLDINMPDLSGIQFARAMEKPPLIVFTTAYPQHAVTGFELDAVDYLLKPIPFERFLKAVQKARSRLEKPKAVPAAAGAPSAAEEPEFLFIKSGYRHVKLEIQQIQLIASERNYVSIILPGRKVMTLSGMDQILEMLPAGRFVRVHKSFIVALRHVDAVEKTSVFVAGKEIPIGESYRKGFLEKISAT